VFVPRAGGYLGSGAVGVALLWAWGLGWAHAPFLLAIPAVATALWVFFAVFLRDPERRPVGPGVVSAADGRVRVVQREGERWRVGVFMNVTDVHVNRFPLDARVLTVEDAGAGHRPAYVDDATHNVQRRYRLATAFGEVEVVQMTGILARRLVALVRAGEERPKGARLGMILLGSRVDVVFPAGTLRPCVRPGDRVTAGRSSIADEPVGRGTSP
jgi:phosphatidylserine decarboxylase